MKINFDVNLPDWFVITGLTVFTVWMILDIIKNWLKLIIWNYERKIKKMENEK